MTVDADEWLVDLRRDLHRHPEPAWREFYTTARIVEALEQLGVDEIHVGRDAIGDTTRHAVPNEDELAVWRENARKSGARPDLLAAFEGGYTGAVAVHNAGDGPTIGVRVDIDGLEREESTDREHAPVENGFRSEHSGMMHACGHDAHATIGVGVIDAIMNSDFEGTLKVFFQPGEELGAGGEPMADSQHIQDVEYLVAIHIGLGYPTGTIVPDAGKFLAVGDFEATFYGASSHAGGKPEAGRSAIAALATAVENLHAIPRHSNGITRVNVGTIEGGTATNVIPERATLTAEARGETNELWEYMRERVESVITGAADVHDCQVDLEFGTVLPTARSDDCIVDVVEAVSQETSGVRETATYPDPTGSEDATFLMRAVQENDGDAAYVGIGTNHPGDHHSATFDVDEESIPIGIRVVEGTVRELARTRP